MPLEVGLLKCRHTMHRSVGLIGRRKHSLSKPLLGIDHKTGNSATQGVSSPIVLFSGKQISFIGESTNCLAARRVFGAVFSRRDADKTLPFRRRDKLHWNA